MRIVLFASAYAPAVGGVEELTRRLAEHLCAVGDEVEVWTNRHPAALPAFEVVDGTPVRRFALALPRMSARGLAGFAPASGAALVRLRRAARAFRPDVLHVQCFSVNGVYATALSRLIGVPLVVSLQGETLMDDHDIYDHSAALRAGLRLGLRRASAVTGCSQVVLDDARRFGLAPGAGTVVFNGVDLAREEPPVALELPLERFVLGVGRFVEKKGFDLLLEAFARLAAQRPGLGLVLGGDGAARAGLRERAAALGLGDRVVLPGSLSRGQVAWAMGRAAVFVLPSRIEPFGIVVLEAMGAGCPVVVSAHGGAPEIVRHEREGLVADPFDAGALAAAIARLLDDDALRARVTGAASERVQAFGWPQIAEQYRAAYAAATAGRGRA